MKATSFKFDEKTTDLIDELKEKSHASSRTEVIRKALFLLKVASQAQENDTELVIKGKDNSEKVILLY